MANALRKNLTQTQEELDGVNSASVEEERIPISSLSKLTGFPIEYIKKELVLDGDSLPMKDLRKSMMHFLNATLDDMGKK